jgi:hypothetical protein
VTSYSMRWRCRSAWWTGAIALVLAWGAGCTGSSAPSHPSAHERWAQSVRLDGRRLLIDPPGKTDHSTRRSSEVLRMLLSISDNHTSTVAVQQLKLGRVTVYDQAGRFVAGFDHRLAWAVVYRSGPGQSSCPGKAPATPPAIPPSGTFAHVQVFVLADDGPALQYSQPASWFCGLPVQPTVEASLQRVSVPWRVGDTPSRIVASVPSCVAQRFAPLPVQRTAKGHPVLAVYAFAPFPPAHCTSTRPHQVTFTAGTLGHAPTVPVDCTALAGRGPEFPPPDGCTLDTAT